MYSVTGRIKTIKQPYGGYLNRKMFRVIQLNDGVTLNSTENIHPTLIGLTVDYMNRLLLGTKHLDAFKISLMGAIALDLYNKDEKGTEKNRAINLLSDIKALDTKSIASACKVVGYDTCFRAGIQGYKPVEEINPDKDTIENIITMLYRCKSFWKEYGPVVKDGFTFEGGYTKLISSGDGDYLTSDTLWDFKVSKNEPIPKYTLQILVYYLMGIHSIHPEFKNIKRIGIFNPRLNKVYLLDIESIPKETIDEVSMEVIGYGLTKDEIIAKIKQDIHSK